MKVVHEKASEVNEILESGISRKIGEGSFVGLKRIQTPEDQIEWLKHIYAYRYAKRPAKGRSVLDIGCGSGYGAHMLSKKSAYVIGIDLWKEGIRYCHQKHGRKSSFLVTSGLNLPFKDNSFDFVTSFQVIEHIDPSSTLKYLTEIKRVLKNGGVVMISTPNKRLRLLLFQKPWNPDHKKEYDAKHLEKILEKVFEKVEILGLFATRNAYLIEYNRVKQNPLSVYIINPLAQISGTYFSSFFNILKRSLTKSKAMQRQRAKKNTSYNYSMKDFRTSRQNLNSSIDLYGICAKNHK